MSELIPPEILNHPDLKLNCPHCGIELTLPMREHWRCVTYDTYKALNTLRRQKEELEYTKILCHCPFCSRPFKLGVEPVPTFAYRAVASVIGPDARMLKGSNRILNDSHPEQDTPQGPPNLKLEVPS